MLRPIFPLIRLFFAPMAMIAVACPALSATTTHIDLPVAKSYALACGGAGGAFAPVTSPRTPGLCLPNPLKALIEVL